MILFITLNSFLVNYVLDRGFRIFEKLVVPSLIIDKSELYFSDSRKNFNSRNF